MRFIGSKERLLPFIGNALERHVGGHRGTAGDLFCGTATVSRYLKRRGFRVVANDNLRFCYVLSHAAIVVSQEPTFELLIESDEFREQRNQYLFHSNYDIVLSFLNDLDGKPGFIFREYSPGGTRTAKYQRRYFSDANAQRIDGIRAKIASWQDDGLLSEVDACLLIADLIRAADRVANIAGTYGCFMKRWDDRAKKRLHLERSVLTPSRFVNEAHCSDAQEVAKRRYFDVLYLDPPYTWRHYGAYYHILETITVGDWPVVTGRTGLRPWEESKSRYCDRYDAAVALRELVAQANCAHLFLSYNSDGLISHDEIVEILRTLGKPICEEVNYRRYKSNNRGTPRMRVKERLYYVRAS